MADYLSLEDAAKKLGIPTERLVDLRSQGEVRGFRDGASWKFPIPEIDRLADELASPESSGSGMLVSEHDIGMTGKSSGNVIGGDRPGDGEGSGSDLELGNEPLAGAGSDVNLVAGGSDGSDVALVADSGIDLNVTGADLLGGDDSGDLLEIDSDDLQINEPAITHDSALLDVTIDPISGGAVLPPAKAPEPESDGIGALDLGDEVSMQRESDLSFAGSLDDDNLMLGGDSSEMGLLDEPAVDSAAPGSTGASSLELMDDLIGSSPSALGARSSVGGDVLSELDLLSEQEDSGLIEGDSSSEDSLLGSSGLGSSMGGGVLDSGGDLAGVDSGESISGIDDSLIRGANDLLIADDDDDLVIDSDDSDLVISHVSDISVSGDSGINLMSPSDSGLSLESEPLDLAGSNASSLDLGGEIADGGGSGGSDASDGSIVDFESDEEFQLSPSGIGLDADIDEGSQVIEVEDSADVIAEPMDFGGGDEAMDDFDPMGGGFDTEAAPADDELGADDGMGVVSGPAMVPSAAATYEVPFSILQVVSLLFIIVTLSLSGMLMTDLVRNMWTYSEPSAPVSSLTDSLISLMGWD